VSRSTIAILSAHRHPRLRYILKELSNDLGYHFRLFTEEEKWETAEAAAWVVYGDQEVRTKAIRWRANDFLFGGMMSSTDLTVSWQDEMPVFFGISLEAADLLSCMFFCLSRFEEYQGFQADDHGRFPASESHAQQNGYLGLPVVRQWASWLVSSLREVYPSLPEPSPSAFRFQPTYDIDLLWAYWHRGMRGIASGIRDVATGHIARAKSRFLSPQEEDPYYCLDYLLNLHPEHKPFIFWLLADNEDRKDPNPFPVPTEQVGLMQELSSRAIYGIHPSYHCTDRDNKLATEVGRIQEITGLAPRHSRQHFLRLKIPFTYRQLRLNGITNDHSMGYADAVGWRAGTNLPFHWYDLDREEATGLTVHPFAAMDVTLKNYNNLSAAQAVDRVLELANSLRPYGGDFALLWHNSSFAKDYGWAGWQEAYEEIVEKLK
jgi:hypothetical protein